MSRSTQMQALSALVLLYREVLAVSVGDLRQVLRSNSPTRLPAVLSRGEVRMLLGRLHATNGTMGLIAVRRGKGGKDRVTMLPESARSALELQLERVRVLLARDLVAGAGV